MGVNEIEWNGWRGDGSERNGLRGDGREGKGQ